MFIDRFRGGPLDGQTRGATDVTLSTSRVTDGETGAVYVRDPTLDTEETRAWVYHPPGVTGPAAVLYQHREGITLGELRTFVTTADAQGWEDDLRLRAVANWRLRLVELEVSRRCRPRPTD